ncbi:MAG: hypothetical protein F6K28_62175, partial [Microcoleus sp. SIO2G3]|nr:hypothetical protein [Microcoleus sp. SIO2G3]
SYYADYHTNNGWGELANSNQLDRLPELVEIYNKAATAMKQIDPTIQVGGLAIARPDLAPFYVPFIRGTVEHLDFFSYHAYATGSADTPDAEVYAAIDRIGEFTQHIAQALQQASPDRHIPLFLDEYNISWTWETRDLRMVNHKGAVFDALTILHTIQNGVDGTAAWNEKDGIYGKTSNQDELRPSAHLFHLLNQMLVGDRVETTSRASITAFAIRNQSDAGKTLVLVNASDEDQPVLAKFIGWQPAGQVEQYRIGAAGYSEQAIDSRLLSSEFFLPAASVTILHFSA